VSEHCFRMLCAKRRAVSGQGQYGINMNDIVTTQPSTGSDIVVPKFGPHEADVVIRHSEYVRDIYVQPSSQVPFVVQTLPLNPGLPTAFPWLSQIASNYEEYSLVQCIYTFKSTIAQVAVNNGQQGQILMATQYKVTDVPFADKESMMMYAHSSSSMLSQSTYHGVECDPAKLTNTTGTKFIRVGELGVGIDKKEYDHGILNIAISNPPTNYLGQSAGELWVSYTVVLRKPKLGSLNGNSIPTDKWYYMLPEGTFQTRIANVPWDMSNLYRASKNTFGSIVYSVGTTLPVTQPAPVFVNGVPNFGSTADPLKILSWDRDTTTDTALYIGGSQNAIMSSGGAVGPLYVLYCVELPDNFQGVCAIEFQQVTGALLAEHGFLSAGNVYPFRDMVEAESFSAPFANRYAHCQRQIYATYDDPLLSDPSHGQRMIVHVRCLPATNGLKNRVYIHTGNLNSYSYAYTNIVVSVYNATLSQAINGSADRLELINDRTLLPFSRI
jgi:hypothetical protein